MWVEAQPAYRVSSPDWDLRTKNSEKTLAELFEPAIQFLDVGVTLGNQQLGMAAFWNPF